MKMKRQWIAGLAVFAALSVGAGTAGAVPPLELNGSVTDASSDIEVAD